MPPALGSLKIFALERVRLLYTVAKPQIDHDHTCQSYVIKCTVRPFPITSWAAAVLAVLHCTARQAATDDERRTLHNVSTDKVLRRLPYNFKNNNQQ